jgi:hypothetical protein
LPRRKQAPCGHHRFSHQGTSLTVIKKKLTDAVRCFLTDSASEAMIHIQNNGIAKSYSRVSTDCAKMEGKHSVAVMI